MIPLSEDPIEGLRDAVGDAFDDRSIGETKQVARDAARTDAIEDVTEGETPCRATRYDPHIRSAVSSRSAARRSQPTLAAFLDGLTGTLHVEERAVLPLDVNGERVTISGIVDLVHETPDSIEIVDYKTDQHTRAEAEYRKQLSVYYHVVSECFPGRDVTASIFYTARGERKTIDPLSREQLCALVADAS